MPLRKKLPSKYRKPALVKKVGGYGAKMDKGRIGYFRKRTGRRRGFLRRRRLFKRKRMGKLGLVRTAKRLFQSIQPFRIFKQQHYSNMEAAINTTVVKYFTVGTYHRLPQAQAPSSYNFDNGIDEENTKYNQYTWGVDSFETDLAFAERAYATTTSVTETKSGKNVYIQSSKSIIKLRNNKNCKVHLTLTWFIPRRDTNYGGSYSARTTIENLMIDSTNDFIPGPGSDFRNCVAITSKYKLVVKKISLLPGESKWTSLKMGGLPFYGYTTTFNHAVFSKRFTRFLAIQATGDLVHSPLGANEEVGTSEVNISIELRQKMKGKKVHGGNYAEWFDLTRTGANRPHPAPVSNAAYLTPIGSNTRVQMDQNL